MKCPIAALTAMVILFVPPGVVFALSYFEPPAGSFMGSTTLANGGTDVAEIRAWSWRQDVNGATYRYLAYQILNMPPFSFSPSIGYFSVANNSGVEGQITGSATSNNGVDPWLGISFPNSSDWIAQAAGELIFPGQYSNQGTQSRAKSYYEYAVPGSAHIGLVNSNVSGGGNSAYGQTYGAIAPELNSFILFGCGAVGLFLITGAIKPMNRQTAPEERKGNIDA